MVDHTEFCSRKSCVAARSQMSELTRVADTARQRAAGRRLHHISDARCTKIV